MDEEGEEDNGQMSSSSWRQEGRVVVVAVVAAAADGSFHSNSASCEKAFRRFLRMRDAAMADEGKYEDVEDEERELEDMVMVWRVEGGMRIMSGWDGW